MDESLPLLDSVVLDELRTSVGGDEEFVRELAGAYVAESADHLEGMKAAAAAGDAEAIVRPAHSLKSSSAALGAMRLSAMCKEIEHAGRAGQAATPARVAQVDATWQATVKAMQEAGIAE
jgi:HPt (histidine-containing phosphotransfer) domain-containing protein